MGLSQINNWDWLNGISGQGHEVINKWGVSSDGSLHCIGYFNDDIAQFNNINVENRGNKFLGSNYADMFITKYDELGNIVWVKTAWGNNGGVNGQGLTSDKEGNVIIGGNFSCDTLHWNMDNFIKHGVFDVFLSKISKDGVTEWIEILPGNSTVQQITTDKSDNIYVVGEFWDSIAFPSDTLSCLNCSAHDLSVFIAKYNTNGIFQWAKSISGNDFDYVSDIAINSSGDLFITGSFLSNTLDFEIDTLENLNHDTPDMYVAKMDSSGNIKWVNNAWGPNSEFSTSVILDHNGFVYVLGNFDGFKMGIGDTILDNSSENHNVFIAKYSETGDFVWVKELKGNTSQLVCSRNAFISKFDVSGNFLWAEKIEGDGIEIATDIILLDLEQVLISGNFYGGSLSLGQNTIFNQGASDAFFCKLSEKTTNVSPQHDEDLRIYPNPNITGNIFIDNIDGISLDRFQLYNSLGLLLDENSLNKTDSPIEIRLRTYPKETCFLKLFFKDGSQLVRKIVFYN